MELLSSPPQRRHETRCFEHAQMLHDAEARHRERRREFGQRLPVFLKERVEEQPPASAGYCLEDDIQNSDYR